MKIKIIDMLFIVLLVSFLVFISGCGTINLKMDLNSDWSYDGVIEAKGEMVVNLIKQSMSESEFQMEFKEIETEDGVMYKFTDSLINPKWENMFSSLGIEKEFKFPFYYYTLTLKNKGMDLSDSEYGDMFGTFGFNFIINPYGKITETNGVLLGEKQDSVRFDLKKTKDFSVTFRRFFLLDIFTYRKVIERLPELYTSPTEQIGGSTQETVNILDDTQDEKQSIEIIINSATKTNDIDYYNVEENVGTGFVYLVLDLTIKNKGEDYFEFSPYNTKVVDNKGYSYKEDISSMALKPYFDSVNIAPGGLASGKLSYAIPTDASGLTFTIQDWLGNAIAQQKLN